MQQLPVHGPDDKFKNSEFAVCTVRNCGQKYSRAKDSGTKNLRKHCMSKHAKEWNEGKGPTGPLDKFVKQTSNVDKHTPWEHLVRWIVLEQMSFCVTDSIHFRKEKANAVCFRTPFNY